MRLAALAALACCATVAAAQRPADPVAAARRAQREFEQRRRDRLPVRPGGGSGPCEVTIGRLCYWNNNDEPPPPPEPAAVTVARDTLLARLARAAALDSASDWIVAQRVRYLSEARRFDESVAVADACRATAWWCDALRGLAYHERGDHAVAAAAFDRALAAMPERQRCRWTDLSWWLDGALARDYRRQPCGPARDAWERRFWTAARPLLSLPGNDLRSELLARRTMSRIRSQGAIEYAMTWGDDFAELEARYGWPTAWSAREAGVGIGSTSRSVVGHEPTPSFAFVPRPGAVSRPAASAADDWELDAKLATMRYAPRYAPRGFATLPAQLARFRRGDSTLVVAAWSAPDDRAWRADTLPLDSARADSASTALVLADSVGQVAAVVQVDSAGHTLVATVAPAPYLASVEIRRPGRGRAARARVGLAALPADTLVSDLLLLAELPPPGQPIENAAAAVLGTTTIPAGSRVALYWETYLPTDSASVDVTVQATRLDDPWYARVGRLLKLGGAPQTPVGVRFATPSRPGAPIAARSFALTWPPDAVGRFRLDVTVTTGEHQITASRTLRVVEGGR